MTESGLSPRVSYGNLAQAFESLRGVKHVITSMAASEPAEFYSFAHKFAHKFAHEIAGVTIHCANPSKFYPVFDHTLCLEYRLTIQAMFLTAALGKAKSNSHIEYVPSHLSQWVRYMREREQFEVFWGTCSLPDERGYVSIGPSCCYESEAINACRLVILEVNPNMPITCGATTIPTSEVDIFLPSDRPLPTIASGTSSSIDRAIADYVADILPNYSTIQLGIGGITNALTDSLAHKKGLGVHTEMINDSIVELCKKGVITGERKTLWPRKVVGAFAYGSKSLYDFLDHNPGIELHPASVVNDPYRIGKNFKMHSINTAVEIDLTGQVVSESIGHRQLSGVGGASDTHTGAQRSVGGRGIIALQSTCGKVRKSKITSELMPGAKVSIS